MPGSSGPGAAEAPKLVVGGARPLIGRMVLFNAWAGRGSELTIRKNPTCPVCGSELTITDSSTTRRPVTLTPILP